MHSDPAVISAIISNSKNDSNIHTAIMLLLNVLLMYAFVVLFGMI